MDKGLENVLRGQIADLRQDLRRSVDLIEYYREFAPENGCRAMPPAHYWIKPSGAACVYGRLVGGRLEPLGKEFNDEDAVAACWAHYDKHVTDHMRRMRHTAARAAAPRKTKEPSVMDKYDGLGEPEEVDLSLDDVADEDEPEPQQVTSRRRRRRIVDD